MSGKTNYRNTSSYYSVFNTIPINPKNERTSNPFVFVSSGARFARAYIHTLPSFKEGEHVNLTPVEYHGGRNYKIESKQVRADPRNKHP